MKVHLQPVRRDPNARRRLSEMLDTIANDPARETIAAVDVRDAMGDRAFGALMFFFAAPNALPVNMPGVSAVLGLPLLFLALQLMLGFAVPWIRRAERLLRPRLTGLADGAAERVIGLACVVLAAVLILPIPFANTGPGIAICVLALALLERDGAATLLGLAVGAASIVLAWGVILGIFTAVSSFVRHWIAA